MEKKERFVTLNSASSILGVKRGTLRYYVGLGIIKPYIEYGKGRAIYDLRNIERKLSLLKKMREKTVEGSRGRERQLSYNEIKNNIKSHEKDSKRKNKVSRV